MVITRTVHAVVKKLAMYDKRIVPPRRVFNNKPLGIFYDIVGYPDMKRHYEN